MPSCYVDLELFWVNRSESQSAAETSVSQKLPTNWFGLLIIREEEEDEEGLMGAVT